MAPLYVRGAYRMDQSWVNYTPAHFGGEQYDTYIIDATLKKLERSRSMTPLGQFGRNFV